VKFMLFIYPDRKVQLTAAQRSAIPKAVSAWVSEMDARGVREQGHVLQPVSEAATVRVRDGETMIGNGPLLDAVPHVSGFNILDCTISTKLSRWLRSILSLPSAFSNFGRSQTTK
jgi:hypothetical protein